MGRAIKTYKSSFMFYQVFKPMESNNHCYPILHTIQALYGKQQPLLSNILYNSNTLWKATTTSIQYFIQFKHSMESNNHCYPILHTIQTLYGKRQPLLSNISYNLKTLWKARTTPIKSVINECRTTHEYSRNSSNHKNLL